VSASRQSAHSAKPSGSSVSAPVKRLRRKPRPNVSPPRLLPNRLVIDAELSVDALKRAERKARKRDQGSRQGQEGNAVFVFFLGGGPREERALDPFEEHRRYIQSLERGRERRRA